MMIWLDAAGRDLGVKNGILRAKDVQKIVSAGKLRRLAEARGKQCLDDAQARAQAVVADAMQQGYSALDAAHWHVQSISDAACDQAMQLMAMAASIHEKERARGYDDGQRAAAAEWHEHLAAQRAAKAAALSGMHEKLAQIVTTAVQRMVQAEPGEALFRRALRNVRALTQGITSLTLRVSAEDHAHAREALDELPAGQPQYLTVELVGDPALAPGSCVFESEHGVLNASLDIQLDALRKAMARAVISALAEEAGTPPDDTGEEPPEVRESDGESGLDG